MTPSGIEPTTFRFVAQYLNHCATISGPRSPYGRYLDIFFAMTNVAHIKYEGLGATYV
jgi:hypothetical protein